MARGVVYCGVVCCTDMDASCCTEIKHHISFVCDVLMLSVTVQ